MKVLSWEVKSCAECPMVAFGEYGEYCNYPMESSRPIELDLDEYVDESGEHYGEIHPDCPAPDKEEQRCQ